MRENQKGELEDLRIREVPVRGTDLRSTSYDEKEEMELNKEKSSVFSFNDRLVLAAVEPADGSRGGASRKHLRDVRRLMCRQCDGAARMSARDSKLRCERQTGQYPIACGTTKRPWARAVAISIDPERCFPANQNPWRNFGINRPGGGASRATMGLTFGRFVRERGRSNVDGFRARSAKIPQRLYSAK
jgi:hypothetical protein